jgi:hypothetical protein
LEQYQRIDRYFTFTCTKASAEFQSQAVLKTVCCEKWRFGLSQFLAWDSFGERREWPTELQEDKMQKGNSNSKTRYRTENHLLVGATIKLICACL